MATAAQNMNGFQLYQEIQNLRHALDQACEVDFGLLTDEQAEQATQWEMQTKARILDLQDALNKWNHKNAAARR